MYQTILFDLDGTLSDPAIGITNSVMYALGKWNITVPDRASLYRFIGPPLKDSFMDYYGFSPADADRAINEYRVYFAERGKFENNVYPGVEAMLRRLSAAGLTLAVATSKPEVFAREILAHFDLADYFAVIAGATLDGSRSAKADVITHAMACLPHAAPAHTIMVGDRHHDIDGARMCGLDSVGVLWGYGSEAELTAAGATHLVATTEELEDLLAP